MVTLSTFDQRELKKNIFRGNVSRVQEKAFFFNSKKIQKFRITQKTQKNVKNGFKKKPKIPKNLKKSQKFT